MTRPGKTNKALPWPWWATVLMAVLGYSLLKYAPPGLLPASTQDQSLLLFTDKLAPLVAMGLLLLAAKQLYDDAPSDSAEDPDNAETTNQKDDVGSDQKR